MSTDAADKWQLIGFHSRAVWKTAAKELQLDYKPGTYTMPPVISGRLDGYYVEVTSTSDRKNADSPSTIYRVRYVSDEEQIEIRREPVATRSRVARGMSRKVDVEIGNRDFDRIAIINAPSVEIASGLLTPIRQQAITDLFSTRPIRDAVVTGNDTVFQTRKVETVPRRLLGNLAGIVQFAKVMGSPTEWDQDLESDPSNVRRLHRPSSRRRTKETELLSYFDPADLGKPSVSDATG